MWALLEEKISRREAVVGVVGLGYVGLPLALCLARRYSVLGFDIRPELIRELRGGGQTNREVSGDELQHALETSFTPTGDSQKLRDCDVFIITVGTPLKNGRDPDLSEVESAAREIAKHLRRGQLVILESTTYPGTTEEILVPLLETSGLGAGEDFGVAYSPERLDPGNTEFRLEDVPKIVGGIDKNSTRLAELVYCQAFKTVVPVSHARVAEATKMIENVFRSVNIALANEIALIMERLDIDTWEAIRAASTKPYGFMAFYPGPGVGGHCIPLDPYYLSYRARRVGYVPRFVELSGDLNEYMKLHSVSLLRRGLDEAGKQTRGARVAILGLAYKRNVADTRGAPALGIIEECNRDGMDLRTYDPRVKSVLVDDRVVKSEPDVGSAVANADAAVLVVDHREFDRYDFDSLTALMRSPAVWVDTHDVLRRAPKGSIALGIGRPSGRIPEKG